MDKSEKKDTEKTLETGTGYVSLDALKHIGETLKAMAEEIKTSPKAFVGRGAAQGAALSLKVVGAAGEKLNRLANEGICLLQAMEQNPDMKMADVVTAGKTMIDDRARTTLRKMGEIWDKGRAFAGGIAGGISGDAEKMVKEMAGGFRVFTLVNEKASSGYQKVMALLRLTTREDVDKLSQAMERLSRRVDSLKEKKKGTGHA